MKKDDVFAVEAVDVCKTYHTSKNTELKVLHNISVNIEYNKVTVIAGASGAGKSTLLHILGGLDEPDSGRVSLLKTDIFNLPQRKLAQFRNKNIGFVFQFHHLLPEFTALENVAIPLMIANVSQKEALNRAAELIELVGLQERAEHKPAELSGGEQQRIAVARALANDPPLIFADEPTGNLDSKNSDMLIDTFVRLKDSLKKTFLIVTHSRELTGIADILYEMADGTITAKQIEKV